jgi:hypothetical protein
VALATALLDVVALTLPEYRQQSVAELRAAAEREEKQLGEEKLTWHRVVARGLAGGNVDVGEARR